jgi:hypothetical protein
MSQLPGRVELLASVLDTPIPDQSAAIAARALGYDDIPVDPNHSLYNEPLVRLSDYGISSLSYYARKNTTGDPIPGVSPDVLVRRDTARRVELMNTFVQHTDWVKEFCGGEVEIRVDEGLRSRGLQLYVAHIRYPEFLRRKLAREEGETDEAFEARVQQGAADSSSRARKSPPHSTGGVVDFRFVRLDGENDAVSYGYSHANRDTVRTDYFENNPHAPNAERHAKIRRLAYHLAGAVDGVVNPLEPWHFGFRDLQDSTRASDGMTVRLIGGTHRFYDPVEGMPDADPSLLEELRRAGVEQI